MQKILQLSDIVGIVLEYCDIPDCITVFEITGKPEKQEEYKKYLANIAFLSKKPDDRIATQLFLELGI